MAFLPHCGYGYGCNPPYGYGACGYVPQHSTVVVQQTPGVPAPVLPGQVVHHRTIYPTGGVIATPSSVVIGGGVNVVTPRVNVITQGTAVASVVTPGVPVAPIPVAPVVGQTTTTTYATGACQPPPYPGVKTTTTTIYKH